MYELFDGVSSDPIPVDPSLSDLGLVLEGRTVPWSEIQSIDKVADQYRIPFSDGRVLVVGDHAFAQELANRLNER